MDLKTVMARLEAAGTEQNRKTYARHGVSSPTYGVSYSELGKLQKEIKTGHDLARELWATGNHDARILATKVADPKAMTAKDADTWVRDCDNYIEMEAVGGLTARTPIAEARASAWRDRKGEWVASAGWVVTARLVYDGAIDDAECERLLERIEREIHERPNRVRHEMNQTLIAIGIRGGSLRDAAFAAAARIGRVDVDHGQTSCVTPDARAYIEKVEARRSKSTAGSRR